ncbi:hypothetical protein EMERY_37 [Brevibacillus phage Emery]|nr:hypothetical protein EMERY_37 [Brevibacillus phage Emery]
MIPRGSSTQLISYIISFPPILMTGIIVPFWISHVAEPPILMAGIINPVRVCTTLPLWKALESPT